MFHDFMKHSVQERATAARARAGKKFAPEFSQALKCLR
jgi:hypothetical protein